jgi:ATP-dependent RNA helicase DeaD
MVSVEFNRFINYYKEKQRHFFKSGERRERDDRDGAQEITMVVQQDIL